MLLGNQVVLPGVWLRFSVIFSSQLSSRCFDFFFFSGCSYCSKMAAAIRGFTSVHYTFIQKSCAKFWNNPNQYDGQQNTIYSTLFYHIFSFFPTIYSCFKSGLLTIHSLVLQRRWGCANWIMLLRAHLCEEGQSHPNYMTIT